MKKKGAIKIGGKVEVFTQVMDRNDRTNYNVTGTNGNAALTAANQLPIRDDEVQSTTFMASNAELKFDVAATKDMGMFMLLDFTDMWDEAAKAALPWEQPNGRASGPTCCRTHCRAC